MAACSLGFCTVCLPGVVQRSARGPFTVLKSGAARAVEKLLGSAQPSVEFTRKKYVEAHDAFVASAAYTNALETAAHVLNKVSGLTCVSQHSHRSPGLACGKASVVLTLSVSRDSRGS